MSEVTAQAASIPICAMRIDVVVSNFEEAIGTLPTQRRPRLHCGQHGILRAEHDVIDFSLAPCEMAVCGQCAGAVSGVAEILAAHIYQDNIAILNQGVQL